MGRELEIAAAASAGGWLRWKEQHTLEPGTPCPNCETVLEGPYCHSCGQLAETFERSVWRLLVEGVESFFHFDGRFWRTLPNLALRPGRLTREYLDGKRVFQIPPLRLFLIVLLLVFFTGGLHLGHRENNGFEFKSVGSLDELKPAERAEVKKELAQLKPAERAKMDAVLGQLEPAQRAEVETALGQAHPSATPGASVGAASKPADQPGVETKLRGFSAWMYQQGMIAKQNPELFTMVLENWAHRFAFLMLPVSALFLSILFVFQRRFYVFDHLIFSMHSLSFQGMLLSAMFLLGQFTSYSGVLLLASPVHLFVHMRGTYGTSVAGTLLRMALLFIGTTIAVAFLMVGLTWVALAAMRPH
jgi:hypothetical protein